MQKEKKKKHNFMVKTKLCVDNNRGQVYGILFLLGYLKFHLCG